MGLDDAESRLSTREYPEFMSVGYAIVMYHIYVDCHMLQIRGSRTTDGSRREPTTITDFSFFALPCAT
jgi:hypothetical protein